jgi:hypothetical protein
MLNMNDVFTVFLLLCLENTQSHFIQHLYVYSEYKLDSIGMEGTENYTSITRIRICSLWM